MNKKGFTLLEVVVSVVLVSLVLTAMLSALVKLKTTYSTSNENTDALVFASSLTRIINNDFEQNGGIRYIECETETDENVCNIILNNNQKRRISVYKTERGYKVPIGNEIPKVKITDPDNETAISSDYIYGREAEDYEISSQVYCEPKRPGDPMPAGGTTIVDNGETLNILAVAKEISPGSSNYEVVCAKEILATTLRYSDTTNEEEEINIYLKTLTMEKTTEILFNGEKYAINTSKARTLGYNFGDLSYKTITYDNSNKTTGGSDPKPYKNTLTIIQIGINNVLDTINSVQDIYLSSESMYSPDKQTSIGKVMCFPFNIVHGISQEIETVDKHSEFCVKNGVEFMLKTEIDNKIEYQKISDKIEQQYIPYKIDASGNKINSEYKFKGFYDNNVMVIDEEGNVRVGTTYFTTDNGIILKAKWEKIEGE